MQREAEAEGGAFAFYAFYPDPSPLSFYDLTGDVQPEAESWKGILTRATYSEEPFKDHISFVLWNSYTKILHTERDIRWGILSRHDNLFGSW